MAVERFESCLVLAFYFILYNFHLSVSWIFICSASPIKLLPNVKTLFSVEIQLLKDSWV